MTANIVGETVVERRAYSLEEVAAALGVSTWSVRKLCREKKLRAVHVGARLIVPVEALNEFLGTK